MSFLEIFTIVASSATIFALIMGMFSIYNGRMTRREISGLIVSESEKTREILQEHGKILVEHKNILVEHGKILNRITSVLDKISAKL